MSQSPLEATDRRQAAEFGTALDRWSRLVQAGGSHSGRERNCAFLNLGDGSFARIDAVSGFGFYDDGRGASRIDWDLDGDLDLLLTNRNGPRVRFLRNDLPHPEHFVAFRLVGALWAPCGPFRLAAGPWGPMQALRAHSASAQQSAVVVLGQ